MKKIYLSLALLVMFTTGCEVKQTSVGLEGDNERTVSENNIVIDDITTPIWVENFIETKSNTNQENPPASIYECGYQNETVYYVPAPCCDQLAYVYDENQNEICSPEGGITGSGDGKCTDFDKGECNILWEDSRVTVELFNVKENQAISSPFVIEGQVFGTWFFEGDFPVVLTNWDGLIIAETYATAQSDWMTEDIVKFKVDLEFEKPTISNRGSLIFMRDNPSDLPENDEVYEIPIRFE